MNRSRRSLLWSLRLSVLAALVLVAASSVSAEQIARVVKYTLADPANMAKLHQLTDEVNELYSTSFAFQGLKLFYDPATQEVVAVSVWESRSGLQATVEANAFKGLFEKFRPLIKGDFDVKTYEVYVPKKKK